jgi:predicted alpha/beta-hydrolase family hydrolase
MEFTAAGVSGFLDGAGGKHGIVLAHGAGSDARAPLLGAIAEAFAAAGFAVLRCDLPFRQLRRKGAPLPGDAARDRQGLMDALSALRPLVPGNLFLGGHSYGGRQATMLAAGEPGIAAGLLLLSYPLHPPRRPETLRTAHFPELRTPALFVHGTRDPFGSPAEIDAARRLIPAETALVLLHGGHDLRPFSPAAVLDAFHRLMGT